MKNYEYYLVYNNDVANVELIEVRKFDPNVHELIYKKIYIAENVNVRLFYEYDMLIELIEIMISAGVDKECIIVRSKALQFSKNNDMLFISHYSLKV